MPIAGTMTETISNINHDYYQDELDCIATSGAAFNQYTGFLYGDLRMITVVPDLTTYPTASATITFLDADGIDVMGGSVVAARGQYFPKITGSVYMEARRIYSALHVVLASNIVNSAIFKIKIYVEKPKNLFQ